MCLCLGMLRLKFGEGGPQQPQKPLPGKLGPRCAPLLAIPRGLSL